uniref:Hyphal_reg_CWP domain-containing protein n=1 Tax=Panagrellus redivivus TaxID=6233 RepID=A0A7E4W278_PANRE
MIGHFRWITIPFLSLFVYYASTQKLASETMEDMSKLSGVRSYMFNSSAFGLSSCLMNKEGILMTTKKIPMAVNSNGFIFYLSLLHRLNGSLGYLTMEFDNGKESNEASIRFDYNGSHPRYETNWDGWTIGVTDNNSPYMVFSYYPNGWVHGRPLGMYPVIKGLPSIDDAMPFNGTHKILWARFIYQLKFHACLMFPVTTVHFLEWNPTTTDAPTTTTKKTTVLTTTTTVKPEKPDIDPWFYVFIAVTILGVFITGAVFSLVIYLYVDLKKTKKGQVAKGQPGPAKTPSSGGPVPDMTGSMQLGSNKSAVNSLHTSPISVKPEKPEGSTVDEYIPVGQ